MTTNPKATQRAALPDQEQNGQRAGLGGRILPSRKVAVPDERKTGTLPGPKPISVSELIKPRYVRKPKGVPKYRVVETGCAPHTSVAGTVLHGTLHVKKHDDLERAMNHWLGVWQHARPSISYSDIDPCLAHWSRSNVSE